MKVRKQYNHNGLAGCVRQFKSQATRTKVGIYYGPQAELSCDGISPWVAVCEEHGAMVCNDSLMDALRCRDPQYWCDHCRESSHEKKFDYKKALAFIERVEQIREIAAETGDEW